MSEDHQVSIFTFTSFQVFLLAQEFGKTSFTSYNERLESLFPLNNFLSFKMLAKICCAIFLYSIISGYQAEVSADDLSVDTIPILIDFSRQNRNEAIIFIVGSYLFRLQQFGESRLFLNAPN